MNIWMQTHFGPAWAPTVRGDMIVVCDWHYQSRPRLLRLPHQLYAADALKLINEQPCDELRIFGISTDNEARLSRAQIERMCSPRMSELDSPNVTPPQQ